MPDLNVTNDDRQWNLAVLLAQAEREGTHAGGYGAALRRAMAAEEMLRRQHDHSPSRHEVLATAFRQRDQAEQGRREAQALNEQLRQALDAAERENTLLREELSQAPSNAATLEAMGAHLADLEQRVARLALTHFTPEGVLSNAGH